MTRDRLEVECEWNGRSFLVVDTGGVVERGDSLDAKVTEQALRALGDSDVVLLVLDTTTGVTGEDAIVAQMVRRNARPVIVVANKVDSERREVDAWALAGLGLGEPEMVSALHGRGVGDLLDQVVKLLPEESAPKHAEAGTEDGAGGEGRPEAAPPASRFPPSPSSGARTWASRPCSTGSPARSAPLSTTFPGRPGMP